MKTPRPTLLLCCSIIGVLAVLAAAQDGGLTGESHDDVVKPKEAALFINQANLDNASHCAGLAMQCIDQIIASDATAFWKRVGTKGKRTLKFITDLVAEADKIDLVLVPQKYRDALSKWSVNPDNTVSVSP